MLALSVCTAAQDNVRLLTPERGFAVGTVTQLMQHKNILVSYLCPFGVLAEAIAGKAEAALESFRYILDQARSFEGVKEVDGPLKALI